MSGTIWNTPPGRFRHSFAVVMLLDMVRIDTTYDNELLTSSREGELELTQERHEL